MSSVLVVIGSGPGIGLATASIFASHKFNRIVLISRQSARLEKDRAAVLQTAKAAGKNIEVFTFSQDIRETESFRRTLKRVEELGEISCVHFNAARVEPSDLLTYDEKEVISDFMVCIFSLNFKVVLKRFVDNKRRSSDYCSLGYAPFEQGHG